jgi:two-component system, OmpR family, response regulator
MISPIYRITDAGREAWESEDVSVPADYRRVLWAIDFQGAGQIEALERVFPQQHVSACLSELEELGLIERLHVADISMTLVGGWPSAAANPPPAADDVASAHDALSTHGAYLAEDRLGERQRAAKAPANTTILIVEDDPDQLALADVRVSMAGYEVRVANSQAALMKSMANHGKPDLVLLDVILPDADGFEILQKLRRLESFADLPIVLLTIKGHAEDIAKGLALGADGYITKPYTKNTLAKVIRRILPPA